jgi:Mn-dependent DtxR family transcriptional regulator
MKLDLAILLALYRVSGSAKVASPDGIARRLRRDPRAVLASFERLEELGYVRLVGTDVRLTFEGLALAAAARAKLATKRAAPVLVAPPPTPSQGAAAW